MRTNELMLYKHMEEGQILQDMTFLMENYQNDYYNMEDMKGLLYDAVNEILEMAVSHGFEGDLWHNYLTYLMASHENAYSTSCETEVSTRLHCMILKSSKNYLIMTLQIWRM